MNQLETEMAARVARFSPACAPLKPPARNLVRPRQRGPSPSVARSLATSPQPRTCGPLPSAARSRTQIAAAHTACRHAQPAARATRRRTQPAAARAARSHAQPAALCSKPPHAASSLTQPSGRSCLLPAAACLLLAACCHLPACCLLPPACLPACCLLPPACCLPTACCLLCCSCREALAAKNAAEALPEFDMVDNLIRALAEHLGRSSPWHQRFHALQELFTASNLELQGIHSVRWLSRGDAVLRLVDVFPAIIVMLSEYDLEMYELATSYRFHFLLFFIADVLEQLNVLNKTFPQTAWFPTCTHLFASSLIHSFTILTDYSRYTTVFPLAKKSDMTSTLIRWLLTTADTRGRRVSCLHSDRGGLVMEIARTSMTHARAPHFLWPYAVRYAAHHLNLWPPVSRREVSPTSLWTRSLGAASRFHVWGCLALVRDTSADKISPLDVPCVFLGFPEDSSDYTFYHPPLHQFFDSRDARFDKSVPYYPTADPAGAGFRGEDPRGASSRGVGVGAEGVPVRGPGSGGAGVGAEPVTAGDSNLQGAGVSGAVPGSATTGGAPSAGPGEPGTDPVTSGGAGSGGGATGSLESGPGATTALDSTPPHPYPTRHQAREQPQQQPQQQQPQQQQQPPPPPVFGLRTLGLPSPSPPTPLSTLVSGLPLPPSDPSPAIFPPPLSPLSPPLSHTWSSRRSPRARPSSPVPFTDLHTALFHSSPPRLSPSVLPSPPESALTASLSTPVIDYYRTYCPVLSRALASLVTDPRASLSSVSTLTAAVPEFASTRCLDYATSLVAAPPTSPLAVGGESALGCDALEDRQFELEFLAAASPHLCAMLLAPEGDPDALDIPTPRTYAEAVSGPWASQWRAAMDSEMASYRSTSTYVNEVPPFGANVVDGMWIFRVKRPPGSPPVFKARYEARGFRQREGVDFFHTFAPTLKMTTLRVLQHVAAQRDYKLHSLDFSTAFLQGSLHEEVWLYRPSAFTGTFPLGTQWRLRRLVYGLRQAPCEWHDTLRSTLSDLGFHPSSADPSLFVRRGSTLFFVLVYADDLVFATTDRVALADVKLKLQKRHSCTDLGELRQYLGLQITRDRAPRTITLSHSHMVQQVLQQFELQHSSVQRTPLAIDHRLTGPFPEESFEPSGPYAELVGCLMYLMTCTRPDLAFPLSILARFVAPGRHRPVHWTAAVRVSKYQATTSGVGLVLGGRQVVVLTGHSISWRPTRSSSVSTSTAEAEICAGAMAAQELRWLTFLLTGLSERLSFVPTLFTDNKATILLCREPRLESRVKYINVRYFLLRELQRRGQARFVFVESEANTADIFTKALPPLCGDVVIHPELCFFVTGLLVEALVCYLKEKQMQHISLSPYVGLQLDKSTDRRRGKHMIVYATFLRGTVVVTEFFANLSVEKCDAGSLEAVLLTHLAACGLELQRISGMTTDGASVMTGGQTGLVARLRTRALAAKDDVEEFPEFNVVDKVVRAFADILGRSIVQHARFKNLQEVITQTNLEMQGIKYVRWLSRGDAIERFADVLPAAVVLLHKYDKATYTLVTSLKFQFFLFFLVDVLQELNSLNLKFQRRQLDATQVRSMVQHTTLFLTSRYVEYGSTFGDNSGHLATFLKNHGSTENREVKVESIEGVGTPVTHSYVLHEDLIGKEKFGGDLASCVEAASKFAGRTVFYIDDRMKSLKSLDGSRLFRQGRYPRSRAKRARQFPEWLQSLRNLFKKKPSHPDTLP
ncbi:unnamed protein product, partial [Closterium sp. NIES-54]